MLVQWLITMTLTMEIILASMQGFLLLSKLHYVQYAVAQEEEQLRLLVGYFRHQLEESLKPDQMNPLISENALLALRIRSEEGSDTHFSILRFHLLESDNHRAMTLFVQDSEHRSEALISDLIFLRLQFCIKKVSAVLCRAASEIEDWSEVRAIEFDLQFQANSLVDKTLILNNHHRWQFRLAIGDKR